MRIDSRSWFRLHANGRDALYWGLEPRRRPPFRFDAPAGEFGVVYAGADEWAAFIEAFGWNTGIRRISARDLRSRLLARIDTRRPLRLVDLTGAGLARIGADASLCTGRDYAAAQSWPLALHHHPVSPDGLFSPARHDPSRHSVALFDHVAADLTVIDLGDLTDRRFEALLRDILNTYGFGYSRR